MQKDCKRVEYQDCGTFNRVVRKHAQICNLNSIAVTYRKKEKGRLLRTVNCRSVMQKLPENTLKYLVPTRHHAIELFLLINLEPKKLSLRIKEHEM